LPVPKETDEIKKDGIPMLRYGKNNIFLSLGKHLQKLIRKAMANLED
jgi:hypothetical protein